MRRTRPVKFPLCLSGNSRINRLPLARSLDLGMPEIMNKGTSIQKLLMIGALAACVPAAIVWFRATPSSQASPPLSDRPLRAETVFKLLDLAYKQEEDLIDKELKKSVNTSTTYANMRARWKVLEKQMIERGASSTEAREVLDSARRSLSTVRHGMPAPHWPTFARRGWIKSHPVWVIAAAWPHAPKTPVAPGEPRWKLQIFIIDPSDIGTVTSRGDLS
jgi:hypothetical protein